MEKSRRRLVVCSIACVAGLHLAMVWLLLAAPELRSLQQDSQGIDIVNLIRPLPTADGHHSSRAAPSATRRRRDTRALPALPEIVPEEIQGDAIHPPPDWADELSRTARNGVSDPSAPKPRDFGFPHSAATPAARSPTFGWDYAATHRIESIPEGGLLVHLNDNCVLVLFPLPFAGCAIGKRKVNGDLFEHMHDPPQSADTP